ncbi:MAG: hypothetical protein HXY25_06335 [Alphaproteobacteria bacterium]|nr:hypothetical protein [Alphaproteobacteria bacterium]
MHPLTDRGRQPGKAGGPEGRTLWSKLFGGGREPELAVIDNGRSVGSFTFHPSRIVNGKLDSDTEAAARTLIDVLPKVQKKGYVQADQILVDYERHLGQQAQKLARQVEETRAKRQKAIADRDSAERDRLETQLSHLESEVALARRRIKSLQFSDRQRELVKLIARKRDPGLLYVKLEPIQVRGLADYVEKAGLARFPFPVMQWAGLDDMLFHTLSMKLGNKLGEAAREDAVAHYQLYSYNQPYLLRGFLEIRRAKGDVPFSVKLYQGWTNAAGKHFSETYTGYLISRDSNCYMMLFNAKEAKSPANRLKVLCLEGSVQDAAGLFEKLRGSSVGFGSVDLGGPVAQEVVIYREQDLIENYEGRKDFYRDFHVEEEVPVAEDKATWVKVFADLGLDLNFDYGRRSEGLTIALPQADED